MINKYSRTKNAKLNWLSSFGLQIITAINGLILPRIIIPTYGSDINGVIASISQFISYMTLLEAGVGSVFRASLYKPLYQNDIEQVSGIINEQKHFYHRLGFLFIFYILLLCLLYPLIVHTELDNKYVITLIILLSIGTFTEYFVSLPYQSLIIADQMVRLINVSSSIVILMNLFATLILVRGSASIIAIKATTALIAILKPIVCVVFTKKHYKLNRKAEPDQSALKQRWNGMVHHFAYYIHRNTDILLLSVFVGTTTVSIYSVYLAIVTGIEKIITSFSGSLNAGIGNMLVSGDKRIIDQTVDTFELIQVMITTILYTITALMLMPFIRLYTISMTDANYKQATFGYILILAEAIYCIRCIYSSISMNGNRFKETQRGAIFESASNLLVSFGFIMLFSTIEKKLIAIAIGTLVGMLVRLIYEINYLKKGLIFRPSKKALKTISICVCASALAIATCKIIINYQCESIIDWIVVAIKTGFIVITEIFCICFIFLKRTMNNVISLIKRKK